MTLSDLTITFCPSCETACAISQSAVDAAISSNLEVKIACHKCDWQFKLETDLKKSRKTISTKGQILTGEMSVNKCPLCNQSILVPNQLPELKGRGLFCPICEKQIDPKNLTKSSPSLGKKVITQTATMESPSKPNNTSKAPIYLLILCCIIGLIYWAHKTNNIPIDQWRTSFGDLPISLWFDYLKLK